jgi:hypothetical protein
MDIVSIKRACREPEERSPPKKSKLLQKEEDWIHTLQMETIRMIERFVSEPITAFEYDAPELGEDLERIPDLGPLCI